ncbi:MAG: hypothetical protein IJP85_05820 [Synergistaceae bacterium]|nr:hypothetical protein [Synergistaceae bacterium]
MIKPVGYENMNPVQLTLEVARHDFTFLHGTRVTDVDDVRYTWEVDNSETIKLIDDAIAILDKL